MANYIRFDWAIKRTLRSKSDFVVLEGFLTSLFNANIKIQEITDPEGNQETDNDKFNRVDVLAKFDNGELAIIEVQTSYELDYFHRMLYGTSKVITDNMKIGDDYIKVKKVYSVNIVYFGLGEGDDYAYHGKTEFYGMNNTQEVLRLTGNQQQKFFAKTPGDLYPEYYILRINKFDKEAKTNLDEWLTFLKTTDIPKEFTAPGLPEAREKLLVDKMSPEQRSRYFAQMSALQFQRSVINSNYELGKFDGKAEGKAEGMLEGAAIGEQRLLKKLVDKLKNQGKSKEEISALLDVPIEDI
jgi:predicted transposase/invertase (TIGR01784 family)